jgi:UDP-2,3-diacylglucosamine hydrolase
LTQSMSNLEPGQARIPAGPGNGEKLGLVAGLGKLPAILARSASEKGYQVVALCLSPEAKAAVEAHCLKSFVIAPGQIGRNVNLLKAERASQLVFVGKIPKMDMLLNLPKLDWTAIRELSKLPDFNDDTIQRAMGNLMTSFGLRVRTQAEFLTELFPEVGVLSDRRPSVMEYADIEFGLRVAKEIARLDIGQTVIVSGQVILAIEAAEGTDRAIQRAVQLARGPVVVIKVSKPGQDQRFDIPTVGLNTLNSMLYPGKTGGVLAVEANQTMVVEKEEMVAFCNQHDMTMVAV